MVILVLISINKYLKLLTNITDRKGFSFIMLAESVSALRSQNGSYNLEEREY